MDKVVYLHRRKTNDKVFYVGMGSLKRSLHKHGRTNYWYNTVRKYGYYVDVVADKLSIDDALELEEFIISEIGLNNLCNLSSGGDHPRFSEETKKKMSEIRKGISHHTPASIAKQVKAFKSNPENSKRASDRLLKRNKENNPTVKYGVKCITDGKEFNSIREAGRYYSLDNSYLSKHLKGVYKEIKGLTFKRT